MVDTFKDTKPRCLNCVYVRANGSAKENVPLVPEHFYSEVAIT
jgi:hypothetical protein